MPSKKSYLTATDQFCGAGGSSLGATKAGVEVQLALNHWKLAIETHNTNFPDTHHDCANISTTDPRRYISTDILITSPECTNHSLAKGIKRNTQPMLFDGQDSDATAQRSRATMFDVPRFAEYHDYNIVIVENVVDIRKWRLWDAWIHAMQLLGYDYQSVYFNSMFAHPTPQSRDRIYVVFWKKNNPKPDLDIRPVAWCSKCEKDINAVQSWKNPHKAFGKWGRYKVQYVYRCPSCAQIVTPYYYASFNAVDWSIETQAIKDRKRPLKARTLERIEKGLEKYHGQYLIIPLSYSHCGSIRATPMISPLPTQTARQDMAIAVPFVTSVNRTTDRFRNVTDPTFTQMPQEINSLVIPTPFLAKLYGTSVVEAIDEPIGTQTAGGIHQGVVLPSPFLTLNYNSRGGKPLLRGIDDSLATVTTSDHHSLIQPAPFIINYYGSQWGYQGMDEATGTQTSTQRHALVDIPEIQEKPKVEDCGFRMLKPAEVGRAMAFPDDYIVLGTQRNQVRQYGQAVTPPVMNMLVDRCKTTLL